MHLYNSRLFYQHCEYTYYIAQYVTQLNSLWVVRINCVPLCVIRDINHNNARRCIRHTCQQYSVDDGKLRQFLLGKTRTLPTHSTQPFTYTNLYTHICQAPHDRLYFPADNITIICVFTRISYDSI